jgi:glycosyltransferase involved in cell wall biosynthesis
VNVLQALFFPPEQPGGVSSMIPYVQERFARMGWGMELFSIPKRVRGKGTVDISFQTFDWHAFEGHPVVDKYMQTLRDYEWWTKLRVKGTYDIIHAHHPIAAIVMRRVFPDTPLLMTVHSSFEKELLLNGRIQPGGPEERFLTSLYGELEHSVDRLMTVSQAFKSYMAPYVSRPENILVMRNGFDEKRFKPMAHENEVPQLITMCRLVPAKGLDVLLRACAELKRRNLPFMLHIIGDGPMRESLEELSRQLGVYDDTVFYGYMLHPEEFMPFFDVFVLPSRAEAFGNVFAEAALCWLALIGTNVGGISEQIDHGANGLLVPVDDVGALADALEQVVIDPSFRYELSRAAWEKAKRTYSLNRVIRQLKQLYVTSAAAATAVEAANAAGEEAMGEAEDQSSSS